MILSPEWAGVASVAREVAPPPDFTVSQWADAERQLDRAGSATPGRWRTDREPWQRGIMDAIHEGAENIVIMKAGQVGVTECLLNIIGYHIAHDPCGMLLIEPSEALAKRLSRGRLTHMLRSTPALAKVVAAPRSRDASQTLLQKIFPGGTLLMAGANSPTALASDPLRLVLFDERNKYPPHLGDEGDPVSLGMKRTETFWNRRHLHVSTPTVEGDARIEKWYAQSDQRQYVVPCPRCAAAFTLKWAYVIYDDDDPMTARWRCPSCSGEIPDVERHAMIAQGEWRSTAPFRFPCPACAAPIRVHRGETGRHNDPVFCESCETRIEAADVTRLAPVHPDAIIGFHVWSALKSTTPLRRIVAGFVRARALGREVMREWKNQTLGEPYEDTPATDPNTLLARLESYPVDPKDGASWLPAGVLVLTAGVDTQDDRLEWRLWGWGLGEERWLIDIRTLPGDPARPEVWSMLDELREQRWPHPCGRALPIMAVAIDSAGHKTDDVYEYVRLHQHQRVYATVGRAGPRAFYTPGVQPARRRGQGKRRVPLYVVGVDHGKANWQGALQAERPGPAYAHLPLHAAIEPEIRQLTSERLTKRRGIERWELISAAARNEGLDCAVLAFWAIRALAGGGTTDLMLRTEVAKMVPPPPLKTEPEPSPQPARAPWLAPKKGWLR